MKIYDIETFEKLNIDQMNISDLNNIEDNSVKTYIVWFDCVSDLKQIMKQLDKYDDIVVIYDYSSSQKVRPAATMLLFTEQQFEENKHLFKHIGYDIFVSDYCIAEVKRYLDDKSATYMNNVLNEILVDKHLKLLK